MTRNLGGRQPEFYRAALRYFCTRLTYLRSTTAALQFFPADLPFIAFLFDDFYQGQSRFLEFHLSQRLPFCFFYDLMYKLTASKDPLVYFFFLTFPSHREDIGPTAEAPNKSAPGKLWIVPQVHAFLHKPPICIPGFSFRASELRQHRRRIHPWILCFVDNRWMAGPRVSIQLSHGSDDFCSNRIQMDVADEGEEIVVFVAEYGFIPIFEEMTLSAVPAVEVLGIPGKEFSHYCGDSGLSASEQQVNMVVHECPGVY